MFAPRYLWVKSSTVHKSSLRFATIAILAMLTLLVAYGAEGAVSDKPDRLLLIDELMPCATGCRRCCGRVWKRPVGRTCPSSNGRTFRPASCTKPALW